MEGKEIEDIYTFYREEIDPEFAVVWKELLKSPNPCESCDVRIECFDGRYCHSHQTLLSLCSQCFREAFDYYYSNRLHDLPSDEELVIVLPYNVPYDELKSIIGFIYNGVVTIPESRVFRFLEVSKFLSIKGLEDIRLVFLNEIDDFSQTDPQIKYEFELNDCEESEDSEDKYWSDNSSEDYSSHQRFTIIKELPNKDIESKNKRSDKRGMNFNTSLMSKIRRVGLQGRRPQIGSPLITEEFRYGDRYQCKVCLRSYLWKKSLVRHYKDLHPNDIQLVTE